MTALDRMPDSWWTSYGHDVDCQDVGGDACVLLRHIIEEEREIALLVATGKMVAW